MSKSFKFDPDYYDNEYTLRQQRKAYNAREDRNLSRWRSTMDKCVEYGYKLVTREQFLAATDRPEGLLERALGKNPDHPQKRDLTTYSYVVYDPDDDYEGWMLWGNDPAALDAETMEMING